MPVPKQTPQMLQDPIEAESTVTSIPVTVTDGCCNAAVLTRPRIHQHFAASHGYRLSQIVLGAASFLPRKEIIVT